jgi:hypothetical protein
MKVINYTDNLYPVQVAIRYYTKLYQQPPQSVAVIEDKCNQKADVTVLYNRNKKIITILGA